MYNFFYNYALTSITAIEPKMSSNAVINKCAGIAFAHRPIRRGNRNIKDVIKHRKLLQLAYTLPNK